GLRRPPGAGVWLPRERRRVLPRAEPDLSVHQEVAPPGVPSFRRVAVTDRQVTAHGSVPMRTGRSPPGAGGGNSASFAAENHSARSAVRAPSISAGFLRPPSHRKE